MAAATRQQARTQARPSRAVHGAADWRKRLRRELLRVGATNASLYIDGTRGIVRVRFPLADRAVRLPVGEALTVLQALPDRAGPKAAVDALTRS